MRLAYAATEYTEEIGVLGTQKGRSQKKEQEETFRGSCLHHRRKRVVAEGPARSSEENRIRSQERLARGSKQAGRRGGAHPAASERYVRG